MWGPSKSWAKERREGARYSEGRDNSEHRIHFEECALGSRMGNVYTRRGYNFREAAQVGPLLCWILGRAASVGRVRAIYQQKNRTRKGPRGRREPEGAHAGWKEEDDGNITNVNKWPNLGGRNTIVHGPSMGEAHVRGAVNVQREQCWSLEFGIQERNKWNDGKTRHKT
ncbi:hypothetical protein B0H13DRAFT_1895001 [Mycena leptocephala]|nr:hypothetical protein B0H13DRAFT_1895001 [Mycena leptocephala]